MKNITKNYPIDYSKNPLFIECDKDVKSIEDAEKTGNYFTWTAEMIAHASNFGNGTIKDFMDHVKLNKKYASFFDLKSGKKL